MVLVTRFLPSMYMYVYVRTLFVLKLLGVPKMEQMSYSGTLSVCLMLLITRVWSFFYTKKVAQSLKDMSEANVPEGGTYRKPKM